MQATACRLQDPDRRDVSLINAFAFGVGHPTSYRVASRPMTSFGYVSYMDCTIWRLKGACYRAARGNKAPHRSRNLQTAAQ